MSTINLQSMLELPISERIKLVEEIWNSVANDSSNMPLHAWQKDVLDQRLADFEAIPNEGTSWNEVRKQITGR